MTPELIELYRMDVVRKRRGDCWCVEDQIYCTKCGEYNTALRHLDSSYCTEESFIWITPIWDEYNQERCLWAMVDWTKWSMDVLADRTVVIHKPASYEYPHGYIVCEGVTLPEALLRAIREQEAGDE